MNESAVHYTTVLWYLEFFAFAIILITFFFYFLYLASLNYVRYGPKYDYKLKKRPAWPRLRGTGGVPVDRKPLCCDRGCIWFSGLVFSISTIGICYYFAYTLLTDTKLRFGLFLP